MSTEKPRIYAIIPDGRNPESVLVGADGEYPSKILDPEQHRTWETVVHAIGRELGAYALSVSKREQNTPAGDMVYVTKPQPNLTPTNGYVWRPRT